MRFDADGWGSARAIICYIVSQETQPAGSSWEGDPYCDFERRRKMPHTVLIVDDSKLARMVMESAFRRIRPSWQLSEATNADDALKTVSGGTIDIALVDFNMPGTDGLELASKIRAVHPTMPVAIVSANMQDEIIARARELNAAFIAKPLTDEALGAFLSGAALRLRKPGK